MNFKRVLVLVMALVMMVSVCAPTVSAIFRPETKHEHHDILNGAELEEKYEEAKATVEAIVKDIEENHEEYYALGYAYAKEAGYIGAAIEAIEAALNTLPEIDLEGAPISDELKADLNAELEALEPTFEKILGILESGEAEEFDGFVKAMLTLEGDLYTHLNNIYAILEQVGVEYVIPALEVFEREVLPKIEEAVNAYVEAVVEHVTEKLAPYYDKAVEIIGIAHDTYDLLVEVIVKINLYVEGAVEVIDKLISVISEVKGDIENAIHTVADLYNKIIDTIVIINAKVEGVVDMNKDVIKAASNAYEYTVDLLVEIYGDYEEAFIVAGELFDYVIVLIRDNADVIREGLENIPGLLDKVYADLLEIIKNAPNGVNAFAEYIRAQLIAYVLGVLNDFDKFVTDTLYGASNTVYELKDDSMYVALGNSPFAKDLADKLILGAKYRQYGVRNQSEWLGDVHSADLITIKVDGNEFVDFASKQAAGTVANIIRDNEKLMNLYNNPILGGYISNVIEGYGIDINAQTETLDWDKYLDAEKQAELENLLALAKAELISRGLPEYYYIDLQPMVDNALKEFGLFDLPAFSIVVDPIEIPVADIALYAIESAIYAHARFAHDFGALLDTVYAAAPEATVVLLGIDNPLEGMNIDLSAYGIDCIDFEDCLEASAVMTQIFNASLYLAALERENTIFVAEEDADVIYEAIHVHCEHIYDNCLDDTCNRCLATRVSPGHTYEYVSNGDATCTKDGTETGTCIYCGAINTRTETDSKLPHTWTKATCTSAKECTVCGVTSGNPLPHREVLIPGTPATCTNTGLTDGKKCADCGEIIVEQTVIGKLSHNYSKATCVDPRTCKVCGYVYGEPAGHKFSDWVILEENNYFKEGLKEHTCRTCGLVETEVIPKIMPKYPASTIIVVVMSAIVFAGAVSAIILWRLRKKDILK